MTDLPTLLADPPDVSVTCLPDGSVDRRYEVEDAAGHVESRAALGERIASGRAKSFLVDHETTEPGGQAVNAARQAHALGADTTLYGHLDHAVFDALACETHSMGRPADVAVLEFTDDAVMFTEESPDVDAWTLDALRAVEADLSRPFGADAVAWLNWTSTDHGTAALREFARVAGDDAGWLVLDPGDVTVREPSAVPGLLDALATVERDVAVSVNDEELAFLADAIGAPAGRAARLDAVRERANADVVVLHGEDEAVAATPDGVVRRPNPRVEAVRYTGAGDRFSAALAYALAADWSVEAALALGNAAATYYVAHAESGDPAALADWAAER